MSQKPVDSSLAFILHPCNGVDQNVTLQCSQSCWHTDRSCC